MIAIPTIENRRCTDDLANDQFLIVDEGRSMSSTLCPRTVEILTALNDVFDTILPGGDSTRLVLAEAV